MREKNIKREQFSFLKNSFLSDIFRKSLLQVLQAKMQHQLPAQDTS